MREHRTDILLQRRPVAVILYGATHHLNLLTPLLLPPVRDLEALYALALVPRGYYDSTMIQVSARFARSQTRRKRPLPHGPRFSAGTELDLFALFSLLFCVSGLE